MIALQRPGTIRRPAWLAALAGGALALTAPSAALGAPDKVIDARTDPAGAGQALDQGCADMSNCHWENTGSITVSYGPPRILGDALYNCSAGATAETAVGVSDERAETTSVSQTASLKSSLAFIGLAKASLEFEAFSKQSETFSTKVSATSAVSVPPGYKGWTETEVLTAKTTGSAYVTQGVHLIEVQNIDVGFPGYQDPNDSSDTQVKYIGYRTPLTADDITTRCNAVTALGASRGLRPSRSPRAAAARTQRFTLTFCRPRRCATRTVTGVRPPRIPNATAKLTRAGRVYAVDKDLGRGLRLTQRRKITRGRYHLVIREKPRKMTVRDERRRKLHKAIQHMVTIVPIRIP